MKAFSGRVQNLNGTNLHFLEKKKNLPWNEEAPKNKRSVAIRNAFSVTFSLKKTSTKLWCCVFKHLTRRGRYLANLTDG